MKRFTAHASEAGLRLDVVLAAHLGISRSQAGALIKQGLVTLNGEPAKASQPVAAGQPVATDLPREGPPASPPELPVVYEDDDLLVVDKPADLLVHPGAGRGAEPTVADFARPKVKDDDPDRPGIVHRLDRQTSGLLIIAKHPAAKAYLQRLFRQRQIHKTYLALVVGHPDPPAARIELPLDRQSGHRQRRGVAMGGRPAATVYRTLQDFAGYALVEAEPQTGRTHQIRAHMAALGHPVAGDRLYGAPAGPAKLGRQFLHAAGLKFISPSGQVLELSSPLPPDLEMVLKVLRQGVY